MESDQTRPRLSRSEQDNALPVEKAVGEIQRHLKEVPVGSPRFQAFADFADRKQAELWNDKEGFSMRTLGLALICETIRQRQNGTPQYNVEYIKAYQLYRNLWKALYLESDARPNDNALIDRKRRLKSRQQLPRDIELLQELKNHVFEQERKSTDINT